MRRSVALLALLVGAYGHGGPCAGMEHMVKAAMKAKSLQPITNEDCLKCITSKNNGGCGLDPRKMGPSTRGNHGAKRGNEKQSQDNEKPACARTCTHKPKSCEEFKQFIGRGGCASTCPPLMKSHFEAHFCPQGQNDDERRPRQRRPRQRQRPEGRKSGGAPDCARTCPDKKMTCAVFKEFTARGGCAATCPAAMKAQFEAHFCGRKRQPRQRQPSQRRPRQRGRTCHGHCGRGGDGQCGQDPTLVWHCNACNCKDLSDRSDKPQRPQNNKSDDGPPSCARTCTGKPESCAEFKKWTSAGGCAATCPATMKAQFEKHFCPQEEQPRKEEPRKEERHDDRSEENRGPRCPREVHHAIKVCGPWIHKTCGGQEMTEQEMGECFIEHRSKAPAPCQRAAMAAFKCEHEKESEGKCLADFGEQAKKACMGDVHRFCRRELPRGFKPTFECMMRNSRRLSPMCRSESRNLVSCVQCKNSERGVFDLCMEAFVKVCKGTKEGEEEQCFRKNIDSFTPQCKAAVFRMKNTCSRQEKREHEMHRQEEKRHRTEHKNEMRREGDVTRKEHPDRSNGPPACARTCTGKPKSCAEFKAFTSAGGCAATCPATMKAHFEKHFCGPQDLSSRMPSMFDLLF